MRCIPRGMILRPTMPGWISCRHCQQGNKLLELPNAHGVLNHTYPNAGRASSPGPASSIANARFGLGMPPLPPGHSPPSEPRASTSHTAEPWATTSTAAPSAPSAPVPKSKAPPPHIQEPPPTDSLYSPSSSASPTGPPPNQQRFNAFQTAEGEKKTLPTMSEASSSDAEASDGPPPWEESVEVDTMAEVKYQGPVTIHEMIDPEPGPSFEDQENALPKRDKIIQICQSDEMFTWIHALATILVINEKAVIGGLKVSEQLKVWQDRIRILKKPDLNTTWEEAMTARPVMGADGLLTIALGEGPASPPCAAENHWIFRHYQRFIQKALGSGRDARNFGDP